MTVWSRISEFTQNLGDNVSHVFEGITGGSKPPEKSIAFTIGMIALGAKMAKADGVVSDEEVKAFSQVFHVPDKDKAAVERVDELLALHKPALMGIERLERWLFPGRRLVGTGFRFDGGAADQRGRRGPDQCVVAGHQSRHGDAQAGGSEAGTLAERFIVGRRYGGRRDCGCCISSAAPTVLPNADSFRWRR